ncbi:MULTISPECIES: hypothetical protein [unclassified Curtobacterium]|uniref:hypothetical protein n=1 Tax=unclassified Curtobacterium TaxID=257496 RepID=UPI003825EE4B
MKNTTPSETTVLVIAVLCIVLGLVVGPLLSTGAVPVWIPVGIGVLLIAQWVLMRRDRTRRQSGH